MSAMRKKLVGVCIDAAAWERQHSVSAMTWCARIAEKSWNAFEEGALSDSTFAANVWGAAQSDKQVLNEKGDVIAVINGSLFSAEGPTSSINTVEMEVAARAAVEGISNQYNVDIDIDLAGKGDDLNGITTNLAQGILFTEGIRRSGVDINFDKVHIEEGMAESERCLVNGDGFNHCVARRCGSLPIGEPQGAELLTTEEIIGLAMDFYDALVRYGVAEIVCDIIAEAIIETEYMTSFSATAVMAPSAANGFGYLEHRWLDFDEVRVFEAKPKTKPRNLSDFVSRLDKSEASEQIAEWRSEIFMCNKMLNINNKSHKVMVDSELKSLIEPTIVNALPDSSARLRGKLTISDINAWAAASGHTKLQFDIDLVNKLAEHCTIVFT